MDYVNFENHMYPMERVKLVSTYSQGSFDQAIVFLAVELH
jgi:hypothetical protein